ncbi:unnamed protein product [Rotaria sp. Silwood2]|nr:unnamed protein product [Rotaria sp. Silwood2]CAF3074178.1 unnamed protein product [Rotaria sp. Silwood2]CAF3267828.1 unnamed protein product [Rotaria sp. Silwood2]CAF3897496.1 unnamed protein product [Rotaria sp. Silwood2]CAF3928030.1 unnamed protein product [Rotaria sp. Silwood2]
MTAVTPSNRTKCFVCEAEKIVYQCEGCLTKFCYKDLTEHRQSLREQLVQIDNDCDRFHQTFTAKKEDPTNLSSMQQIDEWEEDSIKKIKQTAEQCRQILIQHKDKYFVEIEKKLFQLTEQLKQARQEDEFNEKNLDRFKTELTELLEEFGQPPNIRIQQDSKSFINEISVVMPCGILEENIFNGIDPSQVGRKQTERLNQLLNISNSKDSKTIMNLGSMIISSGRYNNNMEFLQSNIQLLIS